MCTRARVGVRRRVCGVAQCLEPGSPLVRLATGATASCLPVVGGHPRRAAQATAKDPQGEPCAGDLSVARAGFRLTVVLGHGPARELVSRCTTVDRARPTGFYDLGSYYCTLAVAQPVSAPRLLQSQGVRHVRF